MLTWKVPATSLRFSSVRWVVPGLVLAIALCAVATSPLEAQPLGHGGDGAASGPANRGAANEGGAAAEDDPDNGRDGPGDGWGAGRGDSPAKTPRAAERGGRGLGPLGRATTGLGRGAGNSGNVARLPSASAHRAARPQEPQEPQDVSIAQRMIAASPALQAASGIACNSSGNTREYDGFIAHGSDGKPIGIVKDATVSEGGDLTELRIATIPLVDTPPRCVRVSVGGVFPGPGVLVTPINGADLATAPTE